jgi:alkanesulfonate monooxygenase SsuD/methylene tetrahydromethanopterin reductase-like flavin-dependent oxidoreductase (luciferase family)
MRCSVWPSFARPWDETLALAQHVEAAGWHGFWYADHYMPDTPDGAPADGPGFECWTVLAGIGAAVPRLRLGSLVSPTTAHHPALLAKRAMTTDHISGGRVILGVGAGWQVNEHRAYGIELFEPKERVDRFAEALQIMRGLLHDQRTTLAGQHFTFTDAPCDPKPVQQPLPIMVGTGSPRMMRLTARWADEWNTWGDPAQAKERHDLLVRACEKEGRDPASLRKSVQTMFFLVDDQATIDKLKDRVPAGRSLLGTAAELQERVSAYVELGYDELIVPDFTLGHTHEARLAMYDRLQSDVLSAVQ